MRSLNVSVDRDVLEKISNARHQLAALTKHTEALRNLMSGEPVELSEKARLQYKRAIVIGNARRGGLQSNLQEQLGIFKHVCSFAPAASGAALGERLCNKNPTTKHHDDWSAEGPNEEQREKAWMVAQSIREQVDRIGWELEKAEKEIAGVTQTLRDDEKAFAEHVLKVALMTLATAPA